MYYSSLVFLLFLCLGGISLIEALGFSVELIHRDSPKSPLYQPTQTHFQRLSNALRRSINRANHLQKRFSSSEKNNVAPDVIVDPGEYLVSYSIGTPPMKTMGILDTGSDVIWLQCKPCNPCFNETIPIFDPSKSTTYKTIPCTSDQCQSVRDTSCSTSSDDNDDQQRCQYVIGYGDRSKSEGDLSTDTLTLGSTKGSPLKFPKTVVGCGHRNKLLYQGEESGIVGIGNGPISLINQLGPSVRGRFSYCLVNEGYPSNVTSKLNFGDDAVVAGNGTVSTPMFLRSVFYYVNLEGFSVGNKRIKFGYTSSSYGKGNIIIDSGTLVTNLPHKVYSELESAVEEKINKKFKRVDDPNGKYLSLCYNYSGGKIKLGVPVITAHFSGGADVKLTPYNTFIQVADDIACFFMRGRKPDDYDQVSILGNVAQLDYLIGFDVQNKVVTFKPKDCSKP